MNDSINQLTTNTDGVTVTTTDQDEKNIAVLIWITTIFFGFISGLIVYLIKQDVAYLKDQAKEALNLSITIFLSSLACAFMTMLIFTLSIAGMLFLLIVTYNLVACILGAVACSSGKAFRVPFALRLIK